MNDRYEGKPFLRLLDCYVLDAIGHLGTEQEAKLIEMTPRFREVFGDGDDWRGIVAGVMKFPEGMSGAIREMFEAGREKFVEANGHEPDPQQFTQFFVDTKFPH